MSSGRCSSSGEKARVTFSAMRWSDVIPKIISKVVSLIRKQDSKGVPMMSGVCRKVKQLLFLKSETSRECLDSSSAVAW